MRLLNVLLSRIGRKASDLWGILKHFPQSRCIFISHWSREKKQSSIIIWLKWLILIAFSGQLMVSLSERSHVSSTALDVEIKSLTDSLTHPVTSPLNELSWTCVCCVSAIYLYHILGISGWLLSSHAMSVPKFWPSLPSWEEQT